MPKKTYKHIRLPRQLISPESNYVPPPRRLIPEKQEFDRVLHRNKLALNMAKIKRFYEDRAEERFLTDDKGNVDIRIAFRGHYNPKFVKKYGVDVFKVVQGKKDNEIIYGKVSNVKLQGQNFSDFERLQNEVITYKDTEKFKTYFDFVKDIKPLDIKEVVEPSLLKDMRNHARSEFYVDISFGGDTSSAQEKMSSLSERYLEKFVAKVNTQSLHYCRIKANYTDVQGIVKDFGDISKIEKSPVFFIETSLVQKGITNRSVINVPTGLTPAFVFDTDINRDHITLNGAVDDLLHNDSTQLEHGTAVASLVVCGARLTPSGGIQQDNRVIGVKVSSDDFKKLDQIIQETVEKYESIYPILIANLSVNVTYPSAYLRHKEVDKLTILLDDLAKQHGCLFVISAGNLFGRPWTTAMIQECFNTGYPDYFKKNYTRISPPADSINNISVGSIAFQESVDSLVKMKSPAVHTRGNLDKFPFMKPDLVHYDSNHKADFTCEENGVLMASPDSNSLTSMPGTSFAAPLVTHDLILLHNKYPELTANSLKALIIHSADKNIGQGIRSKRIRERLIGFGLPDVEKILYSDSHRSTIVIEDEIFVDKEKTIRFPIPASLAGSNRKRLRITKTLVYNPPVNAKNPRLYNPIDVFTQLVRSDEVAMDNRSTRRLYDGAHMKSNVKKYPPIEKSTKEHTGSFWYLKVACENKDETFIPDDYKQSYSVVLTIEDIDEVEGIDIHEEINNMIEIETHIKVPVEIVS
jgi:hypothetical protein